MANIQQKVALEGIRFFAYHGYYPEEQTLGSEFIVDVETETDVFSSGDDELQNTVNYERLFHIAKAEMETTRKLIETVAHAILEKIRHEFLYVKIIKVSIRKMHPPLAGQVNNSLIQLTFRR